MRGECEPGVGQGDSDEVRIYSERADPLIKRVLGTAKVDFPIKLKGVR